MSKKIITTALAIILTAGVLVTGCKSPASKEESARVKVENQELNAAQKVATDEEWKTFRNESELRIKNNEIRIAELKVQLKKPGKLFDALYVKKIETLEQQNRDMRNRIVVYEKNNSDWEKFKREFNSDMDAIGNALKDITIEVR